MGNVIGTWEGARGVVKMVKVLLARDERGFAVAIGRSLALASGCGVEIASLPPWPRDILQQQFDLLLGLDDPAFLAVLSELRGAGSRLPVIVLATAATAEARIRALRAGADDALDHPCLIEELLLRATRLARRGMTCIRWTAAGDLVIDHFERRVWRGEREIMLLPREFQLLLCLVRSPAVIFDKRALLAAVWKLSFDPGTNVVEVHMSRLRAKIDRGFARPLIETVKGRGYRFTAAPENAPGCQKSSNGLVTAAFACVG